MKTAKQVEREAKQLCRFCVVDGNIDDSRVRLVAQSVIQSRRRGYLPLLGRFKRLLEHEYAGHEAKIESAIQLPSDLRGKVQSELTTVYGSGLSWQFVHNPTLIGGVRIKVGSDVYDSSVRSGLAALAKSFGLPNANGRRAEG